MPAGRGFQLMACRRHGEDDPRPLFSATYRDYKAVSWTRKSLT